VYFPDLEIAEVIDEKGSKTSDFELSKTSVKVLIGK
jgi:hypothetical protein